MTDVRLTSANRIAFAQRVRIESAVLARARLDALSRAQRALGQLEDSVQRPLEAGAPAKEPRQ